MTTIVALCACGHAERMHARDEFVGRGNCHHGGCGCPEFQSGGEKAADIIGAQVTPEPRLAAGQHNIPAPEMPARSTEVAPPATQEFTCDHADCTRTFPTTNGLRVHQGLAHKRRPDYERIAADLTEKYSQPGDAPMADDGGEEPEFQLQFPTLAERFAGDLIFPMLTRDEMLTQYFVLLITRAESNPDPVGFSNLCNRIEQLINTAPR